MRLAQPTTDFVDYPWLRPPLKLPDDDLQDFLELGWSQADIDLVMQQTNPTGSVNNRLKAAIGRLLATPQFNAESARLRATWRSLPTQVRPALPIRRPLEVTTTRLRLNMQRAAKARSSFYAAFDPFCERWHLLAMTTWQLPFPQGPLLVPGITPCRSTLRGGLSFEVPWHFPLLVADGVGPLALAEHHLRAREHGIDDNESWETYSRFLEINFWEHVLRNRYPKELRVKPFITNMNFVLPQLLGLSGERVDRLRKNLRQLQSGKLRSLRGRR